MYFCCLTTTPAVECLLCFLAFWSPFVWDGYLVSNKIILLKGVNCIFVVC